MHDLSCSQTAATVSMTIREVRILKQALNEVCNGLEVTEFSTRMGASREEVDELLKQLGDILDRMRQDSSHTQTGDQKKGHS